VGTIRTTVTDSSNIDLFNATQVARYLNLTFQGRVWDALGAAWSANGVPTPEPNEAAVFRQRLISAGLSPSVVQVPLVSVNGVDLRCRRVAKAALETKGPLGKHLYDITDLINFGINATAISEISYEKHEDDREVYRMPIRCSRRHLEHSLLRIFITVDNHTIALFPTAGLAIRPCPGHFFPKERAGCDSYVKVTLEAQVDAEVSLISVRASTAEPIVVAHSVAELNVCGDIKRS